MTLIATVLYEDKMQVGSGGTFPPHGLLLEIIADRAAIYLLGETVLLPDDMSPRDLVAHAGLDPRPRQSGTTDKRRTISKPGNRRLRSGQVFQPERFSPPTLVSAA